MKFDTIDTTHEMTIKELIQVISLNVILIQEIIALKSKKRNEDITQDNIL